MFAGRAAAYDREATFPTENYRDLHQAGLLGISIPKKHGGLGADYQTYALTAAEIGRYCGATALTWNMHVCSTLWTGPLADDLDMDAAMRAEHERRRAVHYKRIVEDGAIYSQPFSEGGAAAAGGVAFGTAAQAGRGRLDRQRQEDLCLALRPCRLLRRALHRRSSRRQRRRAATRSISRSPPRRRAFASTGDWDPLGMRGTVSRTLRLQGRVRAGRTRR